MFHNLLSDEPDRTYPTRGEAEHVLFAALGHGHGIINYLIATTRNGREFFPVVFLTPDQEALIVDLAKIGVISARVLTPTTMIDE